LSAQLILGFRIKLRLLENKAPISNSAFSAASILLAIGCSECKNYMYPNNDRMASTLMADE